MITDKQVKIMKKNLSRGKSLGVSAARSGMDEKTARKYRDRDKLPSELKASRQHAGSGSACRKKGAGSFEST